MNACGMVAGIVLLSAIAFFLFYFACLLSGRISREEEKREMERQKK